MIKNDNDDDDMQRSCRTFQIEMLVISGYTLFDWKIFQVWEIAFANGWYNKCQSTLDGKIANSIQCLQAACDLNAHTHHQTDGF